MKVTTKGGDEGWTSIRFNRPIRKDDPRLEAMGALDELTSFIGLAKCAIRSAVIRDTLDQCQTGLNMICAELATLPEDLEKAGRRIESKDIKQLEAKLKVFEDAVKAHIDYFIHPGACRASACLDICRSVCRRSERRIVALYMTGGVTNQKMIEYLNRMSDLLYLMARSTERKNRDNSAADDNKQ